MSILANAKTKATSGSVKAAFTNEDGAIDLASIMVGIIVIGLIGGVIAATVFAVIPWAQDNAAKQQLDSVASAQSAYIGLSTDGGTQQSFSAGGGTRGNTAATPVVAAVAKAGATIVSPQNASDVLFDGSNAPKLAVAATDTGNGAHYSAAIKSASGKVFYITDSKTQPTDNAGTAATGLAKTSVDAVKGL